MPSVSPNSPPVNSPDDPKGPVNCALEMLIPLVEEESLSTKRVASLEAVTLSCARPSEGKKARAAAASKMGRNPARRFFGFFMALVIGVGGFGGRFFGLHVVYRQGAFGEVGVPLTDGFLVGVGEVEHGDALVENGTHEGFVGV